MKQILRDETLAGKEKYRFLYDLIGFGSQSHNSNQTQEKIEQAMDKLSQLESKAVEQERKRLLKIVAETPITGWDTDGTRVASKLLEALQKEQKHENN